ncbi:MAG: asparagine--tRNA ligase [Candidatus Aenigmarchaeota archaeon]|nr:asparagine--tRNA ligase [Candidatus Aenigmarchaeota archaeon]
MTEFIHISDVLAGGLEGKTVKLRGWAYRVREQKDIVFVVLRDSSGIIQVAIKEPKLLKEAKKTTIESSIELSGVVRADKRAPGGWEIAATDFKIIGLAERFPIGKDLSPEFLLDVRHLWVRSPKMCAIWKIRSTVFEAIREYFKMKGYWEAHAPFFTKTSESGLELFEVDYFGKKLRLSQTWQFYAEALLAGLERIYTIAPSFRAEKSKTARHLTEYWHAEMEAAWMDLDGLAKVCEELISYICQKVAKERSAELKLLGRDPKKLAAIKPPFPRITYTDALKLLEKDGMKVVWGKDLRTPEEKQLTTHFDKPVIVMFYPKEVMAFYKPADPKEPRVARCLDVLVPELGFEVIGGSERDLDIKAMAAALRAKGEDPKDYDWYFDTRRYGAVPHAGFGMGVDRMVQWLCGLASIKDAIPFPRTVERYYP